MDCVLLGMKLYCKHTCVAGAAPRTWFNIWIISHDITVTCFDDELFASRFSSLHSVHGRLDGTRRAVSLLVSIFSFDFSPEATPLLSPGGSANVSVRLVRGRDSGAVTNCCWESGIETRRCARQKTRLTAAFYLPRTSCYICTLPRLHASVSEDLPRRSTTSACFLNKCSSSVTVHLRWRPGMLLTVLSGRLAAVEHMTS
ncbi:hypothetical protein VTK26DRAFT_2746 [Humicola hyalothermophila]